MTIDPNKKYVATIKTSKGNVVVELDAQSAPQTTNNFVFLSRDGFYDNLTFHRVEPGFVIQGGDPRGNGTGGPGYNIPPEIKLKHTKGAIAMARQGGPPQTTPNSGSQFYITLDATPFLDGNYTAFGYVTSGMEVVQKIVIGDVIQGVTIEEK
jgi:cyclophilin family peptidyl-prolyl cis-trans isomerase